MPRINKAKRTKAIGALRKAGMSHENAVRHIKYLDLDEAFGPQIEELAEDFPDLFATATEDKPDAEDKPMTTMERKIAGLKGTNNPYVYKGEPRPDREPTASKAAQAAAEHLQGHSRTAPPPVQKWRDGGPRDLNANGRAARSPRPRPASADALAAKLRGL